MKYIRSKGWVTDFWDLVSRMLPNELVYWTVIRAASKVDPDPKRYVGNITVEEIMEQWGMEENDTQ